MNRGDLILIHGRQHVFIAYSVSGRLVTVVRQERGIDVYQDGVLIGRTAGRFSMIRKADVPSLLVAHSAVTGHIGG